MSASEASPEATARRPVDVRAEASSLISMGSFRLGSAPEAFAVLRDPDRGSMYSNALRLCPLEKTESLQALARVTLDVSVRLAGAAVERTFRRPPSKRAYPLSRSTGVATPLAERLT